MIIFYDQDDVLNLLSKAAIDKYNRDFNDNFNWKENTSYWWEDVKHFNYDYFKNMLNTKGFFYDIEPQEDGIFYMEKLIKEGYDVRILTHPQWNGCCAVEKIGWTRKHIPSFDLSKMCMITDKWLLAGPDRILYDDATHNLVEWHKHGGISIALDYKQNQDWDGPRVKSHKDFYELVHALSLSEKHEQRICSECKRPVSYNSHFKAYYCDQCGNFESVNKE